MSISHTGLSRLINLCTQFYHYGGDHALTMPMRAETNLSVEVSIWTIITSASFSEYMIAIPTSLRKTSGTDAPKLYTRNLAFHICGQGAFISPPTWRHYATGRSVIWRPNCCGGPATLLVKRVDPGVLPLLLHHQKCSDHGSLEMAQPNNIDR